MTYLKNIDTLSAMIVVALLALDLFFWHTLFLSLGIFGVGFSRPHDYFLDVGQGDSELIIFPGNITMMTDAGPDATVVDSIGNVLPADDHYIDIAIISHPQLDHFNGYNYLLDNGYRFGAFIYNGRDDDPGVTAWPELLAKIKAKHIPLITLGKGDVIRTDWGKIDLLSPDRDFDQSAELNDTGFIELVASQGMTTLLTADTGFNVEDALLKSGANIHVDVLKVGHHGSKTSSGSAFLHAVDPRVAVIEVGAHNTYGHPSKDALQRLASSTMASVFRTDRDGTVEVYKEAGKLMVVKEKK